MNNLQATGGTLKGKVLTYALQLERAGEDFFVAAKGGETGAETVMTASSRDIQREFRSKQEEEEEWR
ncbi:MAG TPA: hypothetical protein VG104_13050 [Candidatus Dormibacteraeota bacterium]|jgi:hypothetical protein|nr:hypothetical protein [Candidatus Dormibacteraeota bacterium]